MFKASLGYITTPCLKREREEGWREREGEFRYVRLFTACFGIKRVSG
jgi:hypothetical protein